MEITNPGALWLLIARVIAVVAIAVYVLPLAIRELRRKQRSAWLYVLRWSLLVFILLYTVPSIFPIWSGLERINEQPFSNASTIGAFWQGIRELAIAGVIIGIYVISDLLSRRR